MRSKNSILPGEKKSNVPPKAYGGPEEVTLAADPVVSYMDKTALEKAIKNTEAAMLKAAKALDFIEAARCRDEMAKLKEILEKKSN